MKCGIGGNILLKCLSLTIKSESLELRNSIVFIFVSLVPTMVLSTQLALNICLISNFTSEEVRL